MPRRRSYVSARPHRCRRRFGPGEVEYDIKGFYADRSSSWPFVFGGGGASRSPALSSSSAANSPARPEKRAKIDADAVETVKQIGCIRIQFCKVLKWVKPREDGKVAPRRSSLGGAAAELADAKGAHVRAKAAKTVERDAAEGAEPAPMEAVLDPRVVHESRVYFNDFSGYRQKATIGKAMLEPLTFAGLPLSALGQSDVRQRCIQTFLRAKQRTGADEATKRRIWSWGGGGASAAAAADDDAASNGNAPVPVAALAEFVCETLSPAASRLVCQGPGPYDDDNYGERHVQKLDCEPDHRLQDLDANTLALQDYLSAKPDIYELTALDAPATGWGLLGAFVADAPPAAYAASFAEIVID